MARIRVFIKERLVKSLELENRPYLFGRDPEADVVLQSFEASRRHFTLTPDASGGYEIRDLDAENGTLVDGVREYGCQLKERAVIQAGGELIIYEAGPRQSEASSEILTLPSWAVGEVKTNPKVSKLAQGAITKHVPPAQRRMALAEGMGRMRPHLIEMRRGDERVHALDVNVTAIGYGPLRISLGPDPHGNSRVMAEIERVGDGFVARSKGLFSKIRVNDRPTSKARLNPGDVIVVDGREFRYAVAIDENTFSG